MLYFVADNRPEAYDALMRMPASRFYLLLDAARRNYKPLK